MSSYTSNHQRLLSYTKLLASHVNQGHHEKSLSLFHHMHTSLSLSLDPYVFPLVLKSCAAIRRPYLGGAIHSHAAKSSLLSNPFVACALVDFYGKCVSILHARKLFDEIVERNVVVWNAMISIYTRSNCVDNALDLFEGMDDVKPNPSTFNSIISGLVKVDDEVQAIKAIMFYRRMWNFELKPNLITLLALLPACIGISNLSLIKEVHCYSIRNCIDPHLHLRSGLVDAYGRCGCLVNASNVFCSMREKDVVAWTSLISAYALHGEAKMALEMFRRMEDAKVKPDGITFLGVLKACSHAGLADKAMQYFSSMVKDYGLEAWTDHYSCLVDVLSRAGRLHDAYEVIRDMPVKVTAKTWGALLGACRTYGEVELAEIAGRALFEIEPDNAANYVLLARIYATLGRYEEAEKLRREMGDKGVKTAPGSSWFVDQSIASKNSS